MSIKVNDKGVVRDLTPAEEKEFFPSCECPGGHDHCCVGQDPRPLAHSQVSYFTLSSKRIYLCRRCDNNVTGHHPMWKESE